VCLCVCGFGGFCSCLCSCIAGVFWLLRCLHILGRAGRGACACACACVCACA
jgi:hypothetical protein